MGYEEFLNKLQKRGSKPHSISHCFGARDAYKWVRKNKWTALKGSKCTDSEYSAVISLVNKHLVELILSGHSIEFPHQMGSLKVVGVPAKVGYVEGKLTNNYRVDWKKTLEYWYNDSEARENRQKVKRISSCIYHIVYDKTCARFRNRKFYQYRINRSLGKALGKKAENQKINTLIY